MQSLIKAVLATSAVLLSACGVEEMPTPDSLGSDPESSSPADTVRAATHTCTTFVVGSLEPGAACFHYPTAFSNATNHCISIGLTLGYNSWNISQGTTCAPSHVTYFRYGCCGVE